MEKEIEDLLGLGSFDIQEDQSYKPPRGYQYARLHMIYDVKQDMRKKAQLVCDGSRVDQRVSTHKQPWLRHICEAA